MAVKVRHHKGKYWVFIDHKGQRKAKCIGPSKRAADYILGTASNSPEVGQGEEV